MGEEQGLINKAKQIMEKTKKWQTKMREKLNPPKHTNTAREEVRIRTRGPGNER